MPNDTWVVLGEGADGRWYVSHPPADLNTAAAHRHLHQHTTPSGRVALYIVAEADAKRLMGQAVTVRPRHYRV